MPKPTEKQEALRKAMAEIEKTFGEGMVVQLGKGNKPLPRGDFFSTGLPSLDLMLGDWKIMQGIPRGLITEIRGPDGAGKSTLAMTIVGNAQRSGHNAVYVDVENAFNPQYAQNLGMDVASLVVSQPDYGEEGLQIVETFLESCAVGIIIVDSVANLTPKAEEEGEIGDAHMAVLARLMSSALGKILPKVRKSKTALVFINQLRDKMNAVAFGEQTGTPGGRKLKHNSSLRLDVRHIQTLKKGDRIIGSRVRIRAIKSRICIPFQDVELDLIYGEGFSREADILDLGVARKVVQKDGSWYNFGGERLGHGREEARLLLKETPKKYDAILKSVLEAGSLKEVVGIGEKSE